MKSDCLNGLCCVALSFCYVMLPCLVRVSFRGGGHGGHLPPKTFAPRFLLKTVAPHIQPLVLSCCTLKISHMCPLSSFLKYTLLVFLSISWSGVLYVAQRRSFPPSPPPSLSPYPPLLASPHFFLPSYPLSPNPLFSPLPPPTLSPVLQQYQLHHRWSLLLSQ